MSSHHYLVQTAAGLCLVTEENDVVCAATLEAAAVEAAMEHHRLPVYDHFPNPHLRLFGTTFQRRVWTELLSLSAGERLTYGTLAARLGCPRAVRAVATAVARNPIAVLVPCHRIVPARGGVGQYRWGAARKALLLEAEKDS